MMIRKNVILLLIISSIVFFTGNLQAENPGVFPGNGQTLQKQAGDSLKWSVDYLNKLLYSRGEWYFTDPTHRKPVKGVVNYAENDPLDSVIVDVRNLLSNEKLVYLIERRPQDIRNVKEVEGYISDEEIKKEAEAIRLRVIDSLNLSNIIVPAGLLQAELSKAPQVPYGDPRSLLRNQRSLPADFVANMKKKMEAIQFPVDISDEAMDSVRFELFATYREFYNDSVMNSWRERVTYLYRNKYITEQADQRILAYKNAVKEKNYALLVAYNDKAVSMVNDSLKTALRYLTTHAEADSVLVRLINLADEKTAVWTANRGMKSIRMFLKNAQNDSLSVVLINNGKGELKLVIDDAVKLSTIAESQNRTVTFETKAPDKKLKKVDLKKIVLPPWNLFGNGSIGFTQTSLSNWAKGGESSLALLVMTKYNANYSKKKVKWENSGEFRYGITQTKVRGFEKNDDKIEIQSRFGYSAFKSWYYSAETNFRTQIARGYRFPDKEKPISAFMSPGYHTMSIGLDYKPNKNFSLFLAPFTSKTTYVLDTALIKPAKYGLQPGTRKHWEPGIIVKTNWHRTLAENITYDTKAEFFNNYRYTFQKFAFEWEQVVIMRVNRFINVRVMTDLLYDYNTKFPIKDAADKEIGKEPKWQFKELFTIGLTYKF